MKRDERRVFDCVMEHETVWDKLDKKKIEEDDPRKKKATKE